jgi:hypothetical protein
VLATGPQLIDDIRKAPDDVLSLLEPANEVHKPKNWRAHTHGDDLVPSARLHVKIVGRERRIPHGHNSCQINAGCCGYFQGCP